MTDYSSPLTPPEPGTTSPTDQPVMDTGLKPHELVQISEQLDTRIIITEGVLSQFLDSGGLSLDDDGFIIDADSGEFVEPYAYNQSLFDNTNSPAENVFEQYFTPATTVLNDSSNTDTELIGEKLHVSRLHGLINPGVDTSHQKHPVADVKQNLTQFITDTGIAFENVTEWSTAKSLVSANTVIQLTESTK